jgi:hypothetical protein
MESKNYLIFLSSYRWIWYLFGQIKVTHSYSTYSDNIIITSSHFTDDLQDIHSSEVKTIVLQMPNAEQKHFIELAQQFPNVNMIDAHNMNLTVANGVDKFEKLEILNLPNNCIKNFGGFEFDMTNLKELNLSRNRMEHLPTIKTLTNLEILDLSYNLIESLSMLVYDFNLFPQLRTLNLNNNKFGKFLSLSAVQNNIYLENLFLQNNEIEEIFPFEKSLSVKKLCLQNNKMKSIVSLRRNLKSIEVLDLSNNQNLELWKNEFKEMDNLKILYLNNANMNKNIKEGVFESVIILKTLSINENQLTMLNLDDFEALHTLESFRFAYNEITEIDYINLKVKFPKLKEVSITGNPWNASYLSEMTEFLNSTEIKTVDPNHTDTDTTDTNNSDNSDADNATNVIACLSGAIAIIVLCFCCCKFAKKSKKEETEIAHNDSAIRRYQLGVQLNQIECTDIDDDEYIYINHITSV